MFLPHRRGAHSAASVASLCDIEAASYVLEFQQDRNLPTRTYVSWQLCRFMWHSADGRQSSSHVGVAGAGKYIRAQIYWVFEALFVGWPASSVGAPLTTALARATI